MSVLSKTKGHGWSPVALDLRSPRAACPWHPTHRYVADAPGRPGSARRISPSDSTSGVVIVIGREYRRRSAHRQAMMKRSSRPLPQRVGADDEHLDGAHVIAHRLLGGVFVPLADRLEHASMILV